MVIAIDVGATYTRVGFSKEKKNFTTIKRFKTNPSLDKAIQEIEKAILEEKKEVIESIVMGVPGIHENQTEIVWSPNLPAWEKKAPARSLQEKFPNAQVTLVNDADLAALGEAVFGVGENYKIVAYVAIGTGVGGGLVINKRIVESAFGFEPGHQIIVPDGREWDGGQRGCLEAYVSGKAFRQRYNVDARECIDEKIWRDYAGYLALGIANIVVLWSPEIIIIGGGMSNHADYFLKPLIAKVEELTPFITISRITTAKLEEPGLYGSLAFALASGKR